MTSSTTAPSPTTAVRSARAPEHAQARRVLLVGAGLMAAALGLSLVGLLVDPRVIQGAPAWLKPAKFGISIVVYLLTMRWIAGMVPGHRRLLLVSATAIVVVMVGEVLGLDLQVVRGTTSHFNESTAFDTAVFYGMGGLISIAFVATAVWAVLALRSRGLDAGSAAGIRWGLLLALLGMLAAGLMIANTGWHDGGGHTVGAADGGPGLPLTGWSLDHGDLRIGHFLGLHGLQAMPLLAWVLATRTNLGARTRSRLIAVAAVGWAGLMALTLWQALRGQALLQPDAATAAAAVLLLAAVAGAAAAVLRSASTAPHA
jgi:hypothetical protein